MTQRLYYDDAYLTSFEGTVVDRGCDPCEIYLDRTAFYPTSGGQSFDRGWINDVPVIDVLEDGDRIQHRLTRPVNAAIVQGRIDWKRRFDHMQQHSGQHLLSAVCGELFDAETVSVHIGEEASTLDLNLDSMSGDDLRRAEARVNELVFENRPLAVSYEDAEEAAGLRKASARSGTLRIVTIDGLDRSACGGTHVRTTGEIGPVLLRKTEKVRGRTRVEFLCGARAVRRARSDYDSLQACAQVFSASLDDTPELVSAQQEKLADSERSRQKLLRELAEVRGRQRYQDTEADEHGIRCRVECLQDSVGDEHRAEVQAFTDGSRSVAVVLAEEPAVVLLAVSEDSGFHAGQLLRELLAESGGRGGGNARLAQGRLPSVEAVRHFEALIRSRLAKA